MQKFPSGSDREEHGCEGKEEEDAQQKEVREGAGRGN